MHSSDQLPEEKQPEEAQRIEQASQPIYEFSAHDPAHLLPAEEQAVAANEGSVPQQTHTIDQASSPGAQSLPAEDLIRQGLVYPPPPSFYQHLQDLPASPLPIVPLYPGTGALPPQSESSMVAGKPYIQVPPQVPAGPPVKKSYRWVWIAGSILAVLLLASCGFCGWAFYNFFAVTVGPTSDTLTIANKYYGALQNKDYSTAYGYILPQGSLSDVTLENFTKRAQDADAQHGTIRSYTPNLGNFSTNSGTSLDLNHFTVIVSVTRAKQSYSVLLTLQKSGSSWKIIDFDRI